MKKTTKNPLLGTFRGRMRFCLYLFLIAFSVIVCNLFRITIIKHEEYEQLALDQMLKDTNIAAERGTIYDANMKVLAKSATVWTVAIDPTTMRDFYEGSKSYSVEKACEEIAEILDLDYDTLYGYSQEQSGYHVIKKQIELEEKEAVSAYIKEHGTNYIMVDESTKRYYPYDSLASTVLGFVSSEGTAYYGIEQKYNSTLSGTSGRVIVAKDAKSGDMPFDYEMMINATSGNNVVLTIDETIQHYLEKALRQATEDYGVEESASGIIMNCNTGEIYAMASLPDYNCNEPYTITDASTLEEIEAIEDEDEKNAAAKTARELQYKNACISDTYEPGSVFKPILCSACLEEGIVTPSTTYTCTGAVTVAGTTMHCHKRAGHGTQTLEKGMMNSCNPFFITIGQKLGRDKLQQYFEAFGLTEQTGIDLPGEGKSLFNDGSLSPLVTLASNSFGQSFNVTPIQLITAFAATVNGGYLVQPHVVSRIVDDDGNIVESYDENIKRQVISNETSEIIAQMLEKVVSEGTGKNGYVEGYRVGGKTGTSEKLNETSTSGERKYVASFCAVAPTDDPQIVILIVLNEPDISKHMGGQIAAPTAKTVLSDVLPYLGIEPVYSDSDMQAKDTYTPDVTGADIESAKSTVTTAGLTARVIGNGETVIRQVPASGNLIPDGGTVILYTDSTSVTVEVPDFKGMSPSQANSAAAAAGLNIRFSGADSKSSSSYANGQSITAGTTVEQGSVITVEFLTNDDVVD